MRNVYTLVLALIFYPIESSLQNYNLPPDIYSPDFNPFELSDDGRFYGGYAISVLPDGQILYERPSNSVLSHKVPASPSPSQVAPATYSRLRRVQFILPAKARLRTKINRERFQLINTSEETTVLATDDDEALAILNEDNRIKGLYDAGQRRVSINMRTKIVRMMDSKEKREYKVGKPGRPRKEPGKDPSVKHPYTRRHPRKVW